MANLDNSAKKGVDTTAVLSFLTTAITITLSKNEFEAPIIWLNGEDETEHLRLEVQVLRAK